MKFESKFGIGEICLMNSEKQTGREVPELMVKVISVIFGGDSVYYHVEQISNTGAIQRLNVEEFQLEGDPDFNQDLGCY